MDTLVAKVVMALVVLVWFFVCMLIFRKNTHLPWAANWSVARTLFLLGATAAAGAFVIDALGLIPIGIAIAALCIVHFRAAKQYAESGSTLEHEGLGLDESGLSGGDPAIPPW